MQHSIQKFSCDSAAVGTAPTNALCIRHIAEGILQRKLPNYGSEDIGKYRNS